MDLANILRELWRQKLWVVLAVVPALVVGLSSAYDISLSPLKLRDRTLAAGAASTQLLVDRRESSIVAFPDRDEGDPLTSRSLVARSTTLARLIPSNEILRLIARRMDVPVAAIAATPPVDPLQSGQTRQTQAEDRAMNIVAEGGPYRLLLRDNQTAPVVTIFAQAPTADEAKLLASAAVSATQEYVRVQQRENEVPRRLRVDVQRLGTVNGGTISETANRTVAALAGVGTWVLLLILILASAPAVRTLRAERRARRATFEPVPDARADEREPVGVGGRTDDADRT